MLTEMIGTEELLGLVAFAEFMHILEVGHPGFPIRSRIVGKLFTAISANIGRDRIHGRRRVIGVIAWRNLGLNMEGSIIISGEGSAGP